MSDDDIRLGRRPVLRTAGAALAGGALVGTAQATPGREPGPKEDEVLVGVDATVDDYEGAVERHVPGRARVVHSNDRLRYVAVKFPSQANENARENFIETITGREHIRYAEPNATFEALSFTPNDPLYGDQYAPGMVGCEAAWETTLGEASITISVVDQGIQYDHPNLEGNMDDSVPDFGYDFVRDASDPYPVNEGENHGTHVGGIAAGGTDNGTGHAGISNCSMLSARALDESGSGSLSDIADAITWSADRDAEVINLSLGGGGFTQTMQNAVSYAEGEGSLLVAAAGNDFGGSVSYPAAYDECLAVSALDPDGSLANYSNVGPEIELCAPGTDVLSAVNWDDYDQFSGTSMASPVVAGVAGLALSVYDLDNADLRLHLKETAEDIGLPEDQQGEGQVDADAAVHTSPGDGGDGGGDDGTCGDVQEETVVNDSLSSGDSDCWRYGWRLEDTCQVVVDLSGPDDATFDLYANEGREGCPTTSDYDYRSYNWGSEEQIVIDDPDTSTDLFAMVDAWSGSGEYTLTITEKGR
jgi:serine protease